VKTPFIALSYSKLGIYILLHAINSNNFFQIIDWFALSKSLNLSRMALLRRFYWMKTITLIIDEGVE